MAALLLLHCWFQNMGIGMGSIPESEHKWCKSMFAAVAKFMQSWACNAGDVLFRFKTTAGGKIGSAWDSELTVKFIFSKVSNKHDKFAIRHHENDIVY